MNEEEYLEKRLDNQLDWYDKKSQDNQSWFKRLRLTEIICAALIPFVAGMDNELFTHKDWLVGALGVLVAIAAATIGLFRYQENWIEYRTTAEQLKHERFIYLTGAKPYDTEEKFHLLVERVESLISKENSAWAAMTRKLTAEKQEAHG